MFGPICLGLGAFLLMVGVLTVTWVPGKVEKLPLDVSTTTNLDGTVKKLDAATGDLVENPAKVQSITKVDSDVSTDEVAAWTNTTCVVIDTGDAPDCVDGSDPRLVSASEDVFATDRVTGEAVPDFDALPADAVPHEGLVNKWPFNAEKKDYTYWDSTLGAAVPAVYDREETLLGVDVYVYKVDIENAPASIAAGTLGTYTNHTEIWVEPTTGAIQQQVQDQQRYLKDGTPVLDLKISFTDEQLETTADEAKSNVSLIKLLTVWAPIVGFVLGGILVAVGIVLSRSSGGNGRNGESGGQHKPVPAAVG
ncbi:DUF3068 domain-containing protein [Nocardioides sp. GY 10113]|uniref:DUF3068 domain-containing protein n=1 Tax=Nocardioides sp. GY 10113 TaxID=2569761 RepID=UPI0023EF551E|nr:DUF3068 domain-containing protein [Nocardioides sp. GY 10113]